MTMRVLISVLAGVATIAMGVSAGSQTPLPTQSGAPTTTTAPIVAPLPTPGAKAAVAVLNSVCLPVLNGAKLQTVASAAGLKLKNGRWRMLVDGKREVILRPPDTANPHLCGETIIHRAGSEPAIFAAIDAWAKAQTPPLQPDKVQAQSKGASRLWFTSTWTGQAPDGALGMVLTQKTAMAGGSVETTARSRLVVSLTKS
jgi:hypothetical protein